MKGTMRSGIVVSRQDSMAKMEPTSEECPTWAEKVRKIFYTKKFLEFLSNLRDHGPDDNVLEPAEGAKQAG